MSILNELKYAAKPKVTLQELEEESEEDEGEEEERVEYPRKIGQIFRKIQEIILLPSTWLPFDQSSQKVIQPFDRGSRAQGQSETSKISS